MPVTNQFFFSSKFFQLYFRFFLSDSSRRSGCASTAIWFRQIWFRFVSFTTKRALLLHFTTPLSILHSRNTDRQTNINWAVCSPNWIYDSSSSVFTLVSQSVGAQKRRNQIRVQQCRQRHITAAWLFTNILILSSDPVSKSVSPSVLALPPFSKNKQ